MFRYFLVLFMIGHWAHADDDAPLGPPPERAHPVVETAELPALDALFFDALPWASDLKALIDLQTPVRHQGRRGTCGIFSSIGAVETLYKAKYLWELDLSENYLQYLVVTRMKSFASDGSDINMNIPALRQYGAVKEDDWPYEYLDWTMAKLPDEEIKRARRTCGHLQGNSRRACLLSHMSPERDPYRSRAAVVHRNYDMGRLWYWLEQSQGRIKQWLTGKHALVLTVEFFYGAWRHKKMEEYGIGKWDKEKWEKGDVGIPNERDIFLSRQRAAGHSVVVVGYDDARRIYYVKNSWGTETFGLKSDLLGGGSTPGYGTVPYEYAHRYGTFYVVYFAN